MSKTAAPAFAAIDLDSIRHAVKTVAQANNIPSPPQYPAPAPVATGQGSPVAPISPAAAATPMVATVSTRASQVKITFTGEAEAWLQERCATERCSKLYAVMKALQAAGVPFDLSAMPTDGRRVR
jgi:hypothetical protein